jgi:hypothetical protein
VFAHDVNPSLLVVLIPWETINQELLGAPPMLLHSFLDQLDRDFDWYNLTLKDDAIYQLAI